jgi:hypothetical protein
VTYLSRCSFLGGGRNFSLGNPVQTASEDKEDNGSSTRGEVDEVPKQTTRLNLVLTSIISRGYVISLCIYTELYFSIEIIYLYILNVTYPA